MLKFKKTISIKSIKNVKKSKKCSFSENDKTLLNRFAESYSESSASPLDAAILSQLENIVRTILFLKKDCDYVLNFEDLPNSDLVSLFALLRVIVQENPETAKTFVSKAFIRPCLAIWHGEKLKKLSNALKIAVLSYFCAIFGVLGLDRKANASLLSEFARDSDLLDALAESYEENEYVRITKSAVLFNCAISDLDHDSALQLVCILVEKVRNEKCAKLATRLLKAIEVVLDGTEGIMETIACIGMELGDCAFEDKDACEKWKMVQKMLTEKWKN